MINKDDLKDGHWYIGEGRFSGAQCVGLWDETRNAFFGLTFKFGSYSWTSAEYGDRGFSPHSIVV